MYSFCKEIHPPTGVEHCIPCRFFSSDKESIAVASTSLLRIFDIHYIILGGQKKSKFIQRAEYRFHGNIQCLGKVLLSNSNRDTLLLTFNDAKLSFVEYDAEVNNLKTVSMHQFEDDELKEGRCSNQCRPVVCVDPERRCATLLVFGTHLAVIPFLQEYLLDDDIFSAKGEVQSILPSYTIRLSSLAEPVGAVKDMCFLEGYNNPTLLILCEPMPTWAGRISLRQDSFCVYGLSLNTAEKDHTIIWRVPQLPYDLTSLTPVPKPLGGVLVFGSNSLIYLNQSSPSYGVSLNSVTNVSTRFSLRPSNLSITMDCCNSVFINKEQAIVSLRNGDIYVVTLGPDSGMRGIRSLNIEKVASSVLSSCIACVNEQFIFLGSRLGNSLLLRYYLSQDGSKQEGPELLGGSESDAELFGGGGVANHLPQLSPGSYMFEVCDSLVCLGPVADACVGEPLVLSEEFSQKTDYNLELVLCCGHGKSGSLCVLQRGVRPQIVTTFELPGCTNMWTVLSKTGNEHDFLILSREDSTMVLQTSQEITELDSSGFATQSPTVFAGNLFHYIIQATSTDVRLLDGVTQLCYVPMDMRGGVKSCDTCGPYALVLLNEGNVGLLQLHEEGTKLEERKVELVSSWPQMSTGSKVTNISAYTDYSGLFTSTGHSFADEAPPSSKKQHLMSSEEEDELLYGKPNLHSQDVKGGVVREGVVTYWAVLTRENGALEIYRLPNFELVFSVRNFSSSQPVLCDSGSLPSTSEGSLTSDTIDDLLAVGMGYGGVYPYIMAIINKELVLYEAFPFPTDGGHLNLRFSKVTHQVLLTDRKEMKLAKHYPTSSSVHSTAGLRKFQDIAGYSGVFVSGGYPHWLFMTHRRSLHIHPMYIDGPVLCFAPFNNVNCESGFLYFNNQSELRISVLPVHLSYDSYWPVRRVPLNATPHYIGYHSESQTYVLVSSVDKPLTVSPQMGPDDTEVLEPLEKDDRFVVANEPEFSLQLYSPSSWEAIPSAQETMEPFCHVTSMKVMSLRSQETLSGRKEFIVLGTTTIHGEDMNTKGRLQIFDVIEVIPEPGKPLTKYRLKSLYNQEQKWPVTGLECVDGLILTCMGQKIFMWQFRDKKDLLAVAFIDAETYIHSAKSLRGLIVVSDVNRSVQLLQYQESRRSLALISEDVFPMEVFTSDYLVDGNQLGFLVSDSDQNLVLLQYQPENPDSNGGAFLTRRGDFNIGSVVNAFVRIRCKSSAGIGAPSEMKIALMDKRQCIFYGTLDGGLGYIMAVPEKVYRRLSMLQIKLTQGVRHLGGMNPKAYRTYRSKYNILYSAQRNILDGNLLWSYLHLSSKERTDFAKQIGTSSGQIVDDLKEIEKLTSHF